MFLGVKGGGNEKHIFHALCMVYHTCQFFSVEIVHLKLLCEFLFGKSLSLSQIHHFAEQGSQKPFTATFKADYQFQSGSGTSTEQGQIECSKLCSVIWL
jgi:hypothetical protein